MVKIKICGLTRPCDIEAVNNAKPDYIGFVFAHSRRKVTFERAAELRSALEQGIKSVGVFVNESHENIMSLIRKNIIDTVQLHGGETEEYIKRLKKLTDAPIIKAISVLKMGDVQSHSATMADYILLDNKGGGTGRVFDWSLIGETGKPYFLAGGLNINNITKALNSTKPFALDISSGVETDGHKDPAKIIEIIGRIRDEQ